MTQDDLLIALKNKEGYASETNGEMTVVLDTKLSQELIEKGMVNEFISKVQNQRKESDFEVVNHIKIELENDNNLSTMLLKYQEEIKKGTLCDCVKLGNAGSNSFEFEFNGEKTKVYIEKI